MNSRRRTWGVDAAVAVVILVLVLILSPGPGMTLIGGAVVLALCAVSFGVSGIRARTRRAKARRRTRRPYRGRG